jgi:hypothetical protein
LSIAKGGAQRQQPVLTGIVVNNFNFNFITINSNHAPLPSIAPSDTYCVLGVELNTSLTLTTYWHELKRTTASLITALSTSPLTQSRRLRVIPGLLIGKHFTLQLGLFSDSQLHILDGQICRALHSAVSSRVSSVE